MALHSSGVSERLTDRDVFVVISGDILQKKTTQIGGMMNCEKVLMLLISLFQLCCVLFTGAPPDWHSIYSGGDKRRAASKGTPMIIQHLNVVRAACSLITLSKPSQRFHSGWREAFCWDALFLFLAGYFFYYYYSNRDNVQEESAKA